ncbi:AAA family ATPase [Budviciaceae bacterium BWR-B9]|uniref:AAA family ATPase n=1 Tax=Limnobaculum allomyrinae TaxID=2791986 RepID=A0ABS1ITS1_9GAMM|nr:MULTISPECIES: AAA family ATPase [Limnobaculum]MBK5145097.1 AAA family ATPase [Limnobaculum allomyrinae]MBV7692928.1 AAA family ATPase [Limnobaculum sp. M2-1]
MNTIEETRAAVATIRDNEGVTAATIARESEVSQAALSQFLRGSYTGSNAEVALKLEKWLESRAARQSVTAVVTAPRFIETETVSSIWRTLVYAQAAQRIAIIYGNPGVGKTAALREFSERNPNVWLITIKPSTSSLVECLSEFADTLGLSDAPRRAGPLCRTIRRRITGTKGLLIVDESDHLDYDVYEELRLLQEETGIGLALCGNHKVYSKLTGGNSRSVDYARLFSRISKKIVIEGVRTSDVDAIADAWQLNGRKERELIHKLAAKSGALRTVSTTLDLAAIIAQGADEALSERHIRAAVKDLEGV